MRRRAISGGSKATLAAFIRQSVTVRTAKTYSSQWEGWGEFIRTKAEDEDPYLKCWPEEERAAWVGLYIHSRYSGGLRGKSASTFTASLKLYFTAALVPCLFLGSLIITAARAACRLTNEELRERRDTGPGCTVKLPFCQSLIVRMRERLWEGKSWTREDMDSRMVYLGCIWAYDQDARVSEYTAPEPGGEDHCVRMSDLEFECAEGVRTRGVNGEITDGVRTCWVRAATHKTGMTVKSKCIGRRSEAESQFLSDLVTWVTKSGVMQNDRLFTRYAKGKSGGSLKKELTSRMVRDQVKETCRLEGLPEEYFSSHSLRKAATTHMRALGVSDEDMRDRGGYSAGSRVMGNTYDYSTTGHGPLSANSLSEGAHPDIIDIRRHIPLRL